MFNTLKYSSKIIPSHSCKYVLNLNGIQEAVSSILSSSTKKTNEEGRLGDNLIGLFVGNSSDPSCWLWCGGGGVAENVGGLDRIFVKIILILQLLIKTTPEKHTKGNVTTYTGQRKAHLNSDKAALESKTVRRCI